MISLQIAPLSSKYSDFQHHVMWTEGSVMPLQAWALLRSQLASVLLLLIASPLLRDLLEQNCMGPPTCFSSLEDMPSTA